MTTWITFAILGIVLAQEAPLEALEPEPVRPAPTTLEPMQPLQPAGAIEPMDPVEPISPMDPEDSYLEEPRATVGSVFKPGSVVQIVATSLAFRSGPGTDAPLIHYITASEEVRVLPDPSPPMEEIIAGRPGWWLRVEHAGRPGYIFDAYVVATAQPEEEIAPSTEPAVPTVPLSCVPGSSVGPITYYSTIGDIAAAFGPENLSSGEVDFGGGVSERVTRVYAGTDRELLIRWETYEQTPLSVRVLGPAWRTPKGIGVGTPATTLETLNGKYFAFYGFGWEFAGQVTSWEGGNLQADHTLRDKISVAMGPIAPYADTDLELLREKIEFTSDHPMVPRVNLSVQSMTITLNP